MHQENCAEVSCVYILVRLFHLRYSKDFDKPCYCATTEKFSGGFSVFVSPIDSPLFVKTKCNFNYFSSKSRIAVQQNIA
jgi:hypothetical protein